MVHTRAISKKFKLKIFNFRFGLAGLCLLFLTPAWSQQSWDAECGLGYYELAHAGVHWNYSKKSSLEIYVGTNFNLNNMKMFSAGLGYHQVFIKPIFWKIRLGYSLKAQYWSQDDDEYFFSNFGVIGEAGLYIQFGRILAGAEGGGILNYALQTERKQNLTVGSPSRANGNFDIVVRYRLSKK